MGRQTLSLGADIQGEEPGSEHVLILLLPGMTREIPLSDVIVMHHCGHALKRTAEGGKTMLRCESCKQEVKLPATNIQTVGDLLEYRSQEFVYATSRDGCIA